MRASLFTAVVASSLLFACTQDSASSNDGRDTHMGGAQAKTAPPLPSGAPAPVASATIEPPPAPAASAMHAADVPAKR